MVGAGVGDDAVPDDGGVVGIVGPGPVCGDVYEELLGVPCEERGEVCFEGEADDGVFFLLGGVVVGSTFDAVFGLARKLSVLEVSCDSEAGWPVEDVHLDVVSLYDAAGGARSAEICGGDECAEDEGDCCEEAKDILEAGEGAVHGGQRSRSLAERSDGSSFSNDNYKTRCGG